MQLLPAPEISRPKLQRATSRLSSLVSPTDLASLATHCSGSPCQRARSPAPGVLHPSTPLQADPGPPARAASEDWHRAPLLKLLCLLLKSKDKQTRNHQVDMCVSAKAGEQW